MSHPSLETRQKPSAASTLLLLVGVAIVVGGLLALYHALGISIAMTAFGSLFLLYWAGIQHQSWPQFLPCLIGGTVGIALAWLLVEGPVRFGSVGLAGSLLVLIGVLFFYLRGEFGLLFHNGSMLFLLVATIPELRVGTQAPVMILALAIGAAWIGVVSYIAAQVRARRDNRAGLRSAP